MKYLVYLVPLAAILLGVLGMTIYVLTMALRESTQRLSTTNERLLVLLASRESEKSARALVASARESRLGQGGLATGPDNVKEKPKQPEKQELKPGMHITLGS
ncbi:MAG: hypothetical protein ACYTEX_28340 [Planctomycetota bacterium]|jgi:hypothetical protein